MSSKTAIFIYVISCTVWLTFAQLDVIVEELAIGVERQYDLNNSLEYIVEISNVTTDIEKTPPRVEVKCPDCNELTPVLVVVRQNKGVLSWELPIVVESQGHGFPFKEAARTLCPYDIINNTHTTINKKNEKVKYLDSKMNGIHSVTISLSTSSQTNVAVTLTVRLETDFIIKNQPSESIMLTPSTPRFYLYEFPPERNISSVLLRVDSEDDTCMVLSIQNVSCPVFDLERSIQFDSRWQTMTRRGGLTLTREMYPIGFYAAFVVSGEDECVNSPGRRAHHMRSKNITMWVEQSITYEDYFIAIGATLVVIFAFYIFIISASVVFFKRIQAGPPAPEPIICESQEPSTSVGNQRIFTASTPQSPVTPGTDDTLSIKTDSSLDETDYDVLPDADLDKNIFRTKSWLYVCHLAKKNPSVLKKKSQLYLWNLLTVAVFYFLPVVQLVIIQQDMNNSGNHDLCYYNFLCSHPLWMLADFNHVFSNIGYLFLGFLFIFLTHKRERMHKKAISIDKTLDRAYGIPQHFGLFYAMGAALVLEGVLSGCYHVCPNNYNFQFDTSFMYVISTLCMLKIYQTRHPDINASAYATFSLLAVVILLGMCGVLVASMVYWSFFSVVHMLTCLYLSLQIYYVGRWSYEWCCPRRIWTELRLICRSRLCRDLLPMYPSRFAFIVFANLCNLAIAILGPMYQFGNFLSHVLTIFMANLMLYTLFYIVMKMVNKERIFLQPFIYILLSVLCWASSLYFFLNKNTSWRVTPAQSKLFNESCKLLNFYDNHDIWHFLSAAAMFFSFMVLLTLDDDLIHVERSKIPVF